MIQLYLQHLVFRIYFEVSEISKKNNKRKIFEVFVKNDIFDKNINCGEKKFGQKMFLAQ